MSISNKLLMHVWIYIERVNLLLYLYSLIVTGHCGSLTWLTNLVPIFLFSWCREIVLIDFWCLLLLERDIIYSSTTYLRCFSRIVNFLTSCSCTINKDEKITENVANCFNKVVKYLRCQDNAFQTLYGNLMTPETYFPFV